MKIGISTYLSNFGTCCFALSQEIFAFYFLLKLDDRTDQSFRAWRAALHIDINWYNPVNALYYMVTILPVWTAAIGAGPH